MSPPSSNNLCSPYPPKAYLLFSLTSLCHIAFRQFRFLNNPGQPLFFFLCQLGIAQLCLLAEHYQQLFRPAAFETRHFLQIPLEFVHNGILRGAGFGLFCRCVYAFAVFEGVADGAVRGYQAGDLATPAFGQGTANEHFCNAGGDTKVAVDLERRVGVQQIGIGAAAPHPDQRLGVNGAQLIFDQSQGVLAVAQPCPCKVGMSSAWSSPSRKFSQITGAVASRL